MSKCEVLIMWLGYSVEGLLFSLSNKADVLILFIIWNVGLLIATRESHYMCASFTFQNNKGQQKPVSMFAISDSNSFTYRKCLHSNGLHFPLGNKELPALQNHYGQFLGVNMWQREEKT